MDRDEGTEEFDLRHIERETDWNILVVVVDDFEKGMEEADFDVDREESDYYEATL